MARGLSELQKWVITRAYRHYCENRETCWFDFDRQKDTPEKAEFFSDLHSHKLSRITKGLKTGRSVEKSSFEDLPSPKPGIAHILLPQVVGHIAGIEQCRYGYSIDKGCDGFQNYGNNFKISDEPKSKRVGGEAITRADYNKAYASASRCLKRLEDRGLLGRERSRHWLTVAGLDKAWELTGIEAPARGWKMYTVEKAKKGWRVKYEQEGAYWLKDRTKAQ